MGGKIRKRGCSSSPSSYRFKRPIMVGKTRVGGGSRSTTSAPSWRMTPSKHDGVELPTHDSAGGRSGPVSSQVSARKLAATLWEMNEMPSPRNLETRRRRDRQQHPSHTPVSVSQRTDRSGTGTHHKNSISRRTRTEPNNGEVVDSLNNVTLMEIENRSRSSTPNGSINNINLRLKEVSSALTTSKDLLKIIHRMWAHDNLPSSSMSLVSALHTELERARLQVNHIVKHHHVDQTEVNHLLKHFAEEKQLWKSKTQHAIKTAIESVVNELAVEKKMRKRAESLNKKLGLELADTKADYGKLLKELESEKQTREVMEKVCDELAVDIKRESAKVHEEVEKEREMMQLADKLREERVQMKLAEAKHQFEEKTALVDQLKSQLETVLGNNVKGKVKGRKDVDLMMFLRQGGFSGTCLNKEHEDGDVEDINDSVNNLANGSVNNLVNGKASRKSCSIHRSISDGNEWGVKETPRRSHGDDLNKYKLVKGLRDRILTSLRSRDFDDSGQWSGRRSKK
ncbi:uncharacterized protein LOC143561201 [Bidens hawaiensis]|uniref:uncharacterized protein LOC143561201 n=1 Tax=Bidens hawaiensis TaxID=980011 RepID=UPI00404B787D